MSDRYATCGDPTRRHDFLFLFEVTDGNPNGDPDAGNMPRVDPETMQGLVTDVCLKRKIRNYAELTAGNGGDREGMAIYVQDKGIALNTLHERAYAAEGIKTTGSKQNASDVAKVRDRMCRTYFDIRMFGAVMTTGVNCGQVRGPVQLTFSRSVDPITPMDVAITRVAVTKAQDTEVLTTDEDGEGRGGKRTEMGRKALLPYGLYVGHGFFSAAFAAQTGVSGEDLSLLWDALQNMWDQDRSASRGMMACRGLYVFTHDSALGNAPAHTLFDRVEVKRNEGVDAPRSFKDYSVSVDEALPAGVTLTRLVG
ncbi:MAG: type I-C CRISPR-associated protein Cas7/Csd2 [Actinomycetota bacterium]